MKKEIKIKKLEERVNELEKFLHDAGIAIAIFIGGVVCFVGGIWLGWIFWGM